MITFRFYVNACSMCGARFTTRWRWRADRWLDRHECP